MRIAVVGARGQLGAAVVDECARHHDVTAFDRASFDITDAEVATAAVAAARVDAVVNCAGYNAVDAAESNPVEALRANALAVRTLARAAAQSGAILVQFSSDFVFDGTSASPMDETSPPGPRSVYAVSKLLGEWFARDAPVAYVLRVESLFGHAPGAAPKGSVEAILTGLRAGATVRVFGDRTVSPTYVVDAARATRALLERSAAPGVYHCVNSGSGTWLQVATEAARLLGVEPRFEIVSVKDVALPAQRPQFCALSNAKLAAAGVPMPDWRDALARYLATR